LACNKGAEHRICEVVGCAHVAAAGSCPGCMRRCKNITQTCIVGIHGYGVLEGLDLEGLQRQQRAKQQRASPQAAGSNSLSSCPATLCSTNHVDASLLQGRQPSLQALLCCTPGLTAAEGLLPSTHSPSPSDLLAAPCCPGPFQNQAVNQKNTPNDRRAASSALDTAEGWSPWQTRAQEAGFAAGSGSYKTT
jgi:hypothetical protein